MIYNRRSLQIGPYGGPSLYLCFFNEWLGENGKSVYQLGFIWTGRKHSHQWFWSIKTNKDHWAIKNGFIKYGV